MKFQTITVILVFLLIGVASGSLPVTVSAAASLSPYAQAENSTTVPTLIEGSTTVPTAPATLLTATASLPTTVPTVPATSPPTTLTTPTTVPITSPPTTLTTVPTTSPVPTTLTTVPTTTVTIQTTVPTPTVTTPTTSPPPTVLVSTTLPTSFITIVTFQSQTPAVSIVETMNSNYTPTIYPIDLSTSRTPDIDVGMQPYDGPLPTPTTVVETVTPTNSSTLGIVASVDTSVGVPLRTVEQLENISNASPYQTYTPAPTPASPRGPDLLWILLIAVLAIAGVGGIALLSRSYRGRQHEPGEDVSATPDTGSNSETGEGTIAAGLVSAEGHVTLDQIADYDPATTEIDHLMQMLNQLVQNSQNSLHNPSIRLDDLIRLSGISTLPIPEQVARWGADHGYVVVSRDFQNEALLFRQTPMPGEPDLGIMYIGDLITDNEIPPAPQKPGLSGNSLEDG